MMNFFSKLFGSKSEIYQEQVICYLQKLPAVVSVSFKKEEDFLIGRIQLKKDEDPIYIQAKTPTEFTKMLNEVVYVTFDFKSEYIDFFHKKGDRYQPTPAAKRALEELYGKPAQNNSDFNNAVGFESRDEKKLVPATA